MYTDMDGLGKFKFKFPKSKGIKKLLMSHPLAPLPVQMMAMKKKKKAATAIAPAVQVYQQMPYGGFYPSQQQQQPQYAEPSERAIPDNFDAGEPADSNTPMVTPYESAAASTFGTEEDFMDTSAAYESEAGFLNGLGQESGSTGGWFTDLISTGGKAVIEIAKAKANARAARVPAPIFGTGAYKPSNAFSVFNLNTALMISALSLGGFLLYSKFARKRR
jgi:hypothetical protein